MTNKKNKTLLSLIFFLSIFNTSLKPDVPYTIKLTGVGITAYFLTKTFFGYNGLRSHQSVGIVRETCSNSTAKKREILEVMSWSAALISAFVADKKQLF